MKSGWNRLVVLTVAANAKKSSHPNRVFCMFRADFGSMPLDTNLRVNATNITTRTTTKKALKFGPLFSRPYVSASMIAGEQQLIVGTL